MSPEQQTMFYQVEISCITDSASQYFVHRRGLFDTHAAAMALTDARR